MLGTAYLTVLEFDEGYCRRLRSELGDTVKVVQGNATALPFEDSRFSAVVCFVMLHHIPLRELQNQMFAEIARVLKPGGTFAGTDSVGTGWLFKLTHIGDTLLPTEPDELVQLVWTPSNGWWSGPPTGTPSLARTNQEVRDTSPPPCWLSSITRVSSPADNAPAL